jgi:F-type H+-transporting ATPase subunit alpha
MASENDVLKGVLRATCGAITRALDRDHARLDVDEVGTATYVGKGIARVAGLPGIEAEELMEFPGGLLGLTFNLDPEEVGVVLLGESEQVNAGVAVRRTRRLLDVPVGDALLGRVIDAVGNPRDGKGPVRTTERRHVEQPAAPIMDRQPVTVPLQTGLKVVDALIPIGRGQRELILGDRQTGKTAIAIDTIINQQHYGVRCVYCAIGQRSSAVAKVLTDLRHHDAMDYTAVVATTGDDPPGLQYVAPYAATSIAEHFAYRGEDVLIVYDDLTAHARAYRELSLLLRRPPGREAYPGDIFYVHSRMLERATNLREDRGGGSLTALPIAQTEEQNLSAYIPTNLISITDGQIYVSPQLQQKGLLPAVDVGESVSRVGGKAQLPAYRRVAGDLRLSYSQFEELEAFSRFGTRLDEETRKMLERGRCIRETLKQPQYEPVSPAEQMAALLAVTKGVFDGLQLHQMAKAEMAVRRALRDKLSEIAEKIERAEKLTDEDEERMLTEARRVADHLREG